MDLKRQNLSSCHRIVVKVGSGLLADEMFRLALDRVQQLAREVASLAYDGREVVLVSSGAVAAGMGVLGLAKRPWRVKDLQACAATGQSKLMAAYDEAFSRRNVLVAQVLLTYDDLSDRSRHLNARNTLEGLIQRKVLPIINENDTVAVDEIKFGDNDRLAALTAALVDADLLIVLSHVEGLISLFGTTKDPRPRQVIPTVPEITRDIELLAKGTNGITNVGGMRSKIEAAKIVTRAGIPMIIANGERANVLADLLAGEDVGTIFLAKTGKLESRKRWIAFFQRPTGALIVDEGAKQALCAGGKSLLSKGVVATAGVFTRGAVVAIRDENEIEFARGLTKVNSDEIAAATGVIVHRDDLVVL